MLRLLFGLLVFAWTSCLDDLPTDGPFACRQAGDCVDGFVCDPVRFVCVDENASPTPDAGNPPDAGTTPDAG